MSKICVGVGMLACYLILGLSLMLSTGCSKETVSAQADFAMPEDLKDCKIYRMSSSGGVTVYVMRCPNSITSCNTTGKHATHSVCVDKIKCE